MRFLISEKLGPHKYKTTEGYLVCVDAILSRTGTQEYRRHELFGDACDDPDKIITVDRNSDEVFSDKTMASFENKAICIEHPNANVNVENHNDLSVGFVRDIHRGEDNGTPVMMGTLVITDKEAVEAVESGEYKELSCGYDCDIEDEHSPQQRNIRGNHVALCKQGRAGIARIVDSETLDSVRAKEFFASTGLSTSKGGFGSLLFLKTVANSRSEAERKFAKYLKGRSVGNTSPTAFESSSAYRSYMGTTWGSGGKVEVVDATKDAYTDFEYGYRDGKLGKYDKWYRYNRKDEGKEYDMGIQKAKGEGYEIKKFIKGTGDSMKIEHLTDMDYRDSIDDASWEDFQAGDIIEGYDRFAGNGPENTYRVLQRVGKGKYRVEPVSPGAVKFAKGKNVMVIKVPEEAYKLKDSITEDSVYTVEYVKDNVTHIVEIEASSLEDAISKAKDSIVKDGRNIYLSSGEKLNTDTAIVEYKRKKCKVHEASSDGTNINISTIGPGILYKWVNIKEVKILKH